MKLTQLKSIQIISLISIFNLSIIAIPTGEAQILDNFGGTNVTQVETTPESPQSNFLVTLFGITNNTDNVFVFVEANNMSKGALIDATERDLTDGSGDGMVQAYMTMPNVTLTGGAEYTACGVVLNTVHMVCDAHHVSPFTKTQFAELMMSGKNTSSYRDLDNATIK